MEDTKEYRSTLPKLEEKDIPPMPAVKQPRNIGGYEAIKVIGETGKTPDQIMGSDIIIFITNRNEMFFDPDYRAMIRKQSLLPTMIIPHGYRVQIARTIWSQVAVVYDQMHPFKTADDEIKAHAIIRRESPVPVMIVPHHDVQFEVHSASDERQLIVMADIVPGPETR